MYKYRITIIREDGDEECFSLSSEAVFVKKKYALEVVDFVENLIGFSPTLGMHGYYIQTDVYKVES